MRRTMTTRTLTSAALVLAAALVLGVGAARAQGRPAVRPAVMAVLRAPDATLDRAALARLGPTLDAELRAAATDTRLAWGARARAYALLGYFPSTSNRQFLELALGDKTLPPALRAPVIRALGWAYGEKDGTAIRRLVMPFRNDLDARVRAAARHVIDVAGTPLSRPSGPRRQPSPR